MKKLMIFFICLTLAVGTVCSCAKDDKPPVVDLGGDSRTDQGEVNDTYQPPNYGIVDTEINVGVGSDVLYPDTDSVEPPYKQVEYDINIIGDYEIMSESVYKIEALVGSTRETRYGRVVALVRNNGIPAVYLDVLSSEQSAVVCSKIFNGMCKVFVDSKLESLFVYSTTVSSDGRCIINAGSYMVSDIDSMGKPHEGGGLAFVTANRGSSQTINLTQPEAIYKSLLRSMVSTIDDKTSDMYCTIADTVAKPITYDIGTHEKVQSAEEYLTVDILNKFFEDKFSNS
jgi:hypothetical protein